MKLTRLLCLFGHKFLITVRDGRWVLDSCVRCGKEPRG